VHLKKHLSFIALRDTMAECFRQIKDGRQVQKVRHCLHDVLMSGFAMMFFQDPSITRFQRGLQEIANYNNLLTIFGIGSIPKDTQMRDVIDVIPTEKLRGIFPAFLTKLQRGKQLSQYQLLKGKYLVALDGSEYFSSNTISCPQCLKKEPAKGDIRYHHQILQAVIVHPDCRQVLPLFPEPIQNSDGMDKQDCEINAGKRILGKIRKAHPKLPIIITADDLYSKQPFVDSLTDNGMSFILTAKPSDHKILFEWVEELTRMGGEGHLEMLDMKGKCHKYHWVNDVPLNGTKNAGQVNFFQYWIRDGEKITYHNSWVTDIAVDQNNITMLVRAGRARWKIENETFNTLKNQGYHIEHNYGHGNQYLSMNFFVLNLLAFFVHQILELCDLSYQRCRGKFSARREFWNQLRYALRLILFRDYYPLLDYIYYPHKLRAP